jgi:hypothetical protein
MMINGSTEEVEIYYGLDLEYHWSVGTHTAGNCESREEAMRCISLHLSNNGGYFELIQKEEPQRANLLLENIRLRTALKTMRELVAALPKCNLCDNTATTRLNHLYGRRCADHPMTGDLKDGVTQTLQTILTTLSSLKDIE